MLWNSSYIIAVSYFNSFRRFLVYIYWDCRYIHKIEIHISSLYITNVLNISSNRPSFIPINQKSSILREKLE